MFEVVVEPSCDEEHFDARGASSLRDPGNPKLMDHNDIRRHPSRFLHELGDFGPRLSTRSVSRRHHVARAQRSLNLGQEPPHVVRYVSLRNS